MLTIITIVLILAAAFLCFLATRPDSFLIHVIRIDKSPGTIFPLINDLHAWADWSPWDKKDP